MYNSDVKKQILRSNILKCKKLHFYKILKFYINGKKCWTEHNWLSSHMYSNLHMWLIESHKTASAHVYFHRWTKILR